MGENAKKEYVPSVKLNLIPPKNRVAFVAFRRWAPLVSAAIDLRHELLIHICPATTVGAEGSKSCGFGAFVPRGRFAEIWIAGEPPIKCSAEDHRRALLEVFGHELAHYEQWRDGRKLQERGVAVRGRSISRRVMAAVSRH